jgi:selenocysteine lyase/cysteine desulfurase
VHIAPQAEKTLANIRRAMQKNTRAVIMTAVSNVTGQILPVGDISALCQKHGILYIADGAQACGVIPLRVDGGITVLCTAGHKGFYAPAGTGMLLTDGTVQPAPLMQGGTGSQSGSPEQPDYLPDALESGTLNVSGIAGMDAGMQMVQRIGMQNIFSHESALCGQFMAGLRKTDDAVIFRTEGADYAPLVSFRLKGESPSQTAERLAAAGICMRAGLHCAPLAHHAIGTAAEGTVRFSPSVFNTEKEVDYALNILAQRA